MFEYLKVKLKVLIFFTFLLDLSEPYFFNAFELNKLKNENTTVYRERIFGGQQKEFNHSFLIYVVIKDMKELNQCGGALIAPKYVVTAAHCFGFSRMALKNVILVSGKADMRDYVKDRISLEFHENVNETQLNVQEIRAKHVFLHPDFSSYTSYHDIAVVQAHHSFNPNFSKPIPWSSNRLEGRILCTIVGWGMNPATGSDYVLQIVEKVPISAVHLGCKIRNMGSFLCMYNPKGKICAGDSGSPLLCGTKIWGVASHGVKSKPEDDCTSTVESYYTDFYTHKEWLSNVIENGQSTLKITSSILLCFTVTLQSVASY